MTLKLTSLTRKIEDILRNNDYLNSHLVADIKAAREQLGTYIDGDTAARNFFLAEIEDNPQLTQEIARTALFDAQWSVISQYALWLAEEDDNNDEESEESDNDDNDEEGEEDE